jgi:GAF domain-containing protein
MIALDPDTISTLLELAALLAIALASAWAGGRSAAENLAERRLDRWEDKP